MGIKTGIDKKKLIILLLTILIIIALAVVMFLRSNSSGPAFEGTPETGPVSMPSIDLEKRKFQNSIVLPISRLIVTHARWAYEDNAMRLVVPRLDLDTMVRNGTELEVLEKGPGLYKYAQIPDLYNTNTSIAAHRDLYGCEFYYLDTVTDGDYMYVVYKDIVFTYEYKSTEIIESTNWDPIRVFEDCRLTLTTCDPIGTSLNRMVVVGELLSVDEYSEDFVFA